MDYNLIEGILNQAENDLKKKTVPELKAIAKEKDLKVGGTKGELLERILDTMEEEETVDVPRFLSKYEVLLKMKTEFHQVPEHLEKAYEKFKDV